MEIMRMDCLNNQLAAREEELESVLGQHLAELETIKKRLANPRVSKGKKEKYWYRKQVLEKRVIPRISQRLTELSFHI